MKRSFLSLFAISLSLASAILADEAPRNYATYPVPREGNWVKSHEAFNAISKEGTAPLVFLGDSITAGWGGKGKEEWEKSWAPLKAANFGIGGDRTEHVLWRLEHGNFDGLKPKAIVLMIGTNNTGHEGRAQKELNGAIYHCTAEQTADGVKAILGTLHQKMPETKILLLGIFPRGADSKDKMRRQNEETNAIIARFADNKTVYYMDIGKTFLEPDGTLSKEIMPDLLHPNAKGYEIWTAAIKDKVAELMK
ncbi:MAG: lipolytic protein family [Verrucomicrobiaceae bacterium]|nr:lipolytic protein family [Verrucomicrobiaceae bacterium]